MHRIKKSKAVRHNLQGATQIPQGFQFTETPSQGQPIYQLVGFQNDYLMNILIPLIEYLNQVGLGQKYEECGETFPQMEKNNGSIALIHKVINQSWFKRRINLTGLVSIISNKILLNPKINKKLFHLLVIQQIFTNTHLSLEQFEKLINQKTKKISKSKLPSDSIFRFDSSIVYLLSLFYGFLYKDLGDLCHEPPKKERDKYIKKSLNKQRPLQIQMSGKPVIPKHSYRCYVLHIIDQLNAFNKDPRQLLDFLGDFKDKITGIERDLRKKFNLTKSVPDWSYFKQIVVNNCIISKIRGQKITKDQFESWIQQFKLKSTSSKGYEELFAKQYQGKPNQALIIIKQQPPLK